jgi:hypothetical protein
MTDAVPVKYMPVRSPLWNLIIDTSFEGQGREICRCNSPKDAQRICYLLNTAEGYEYPKPEDME